MQKGAAVQAQAVVVSIGAGGSGGAVTVGGGDGADRRSVGGTGCEKARAKQKRQGSATVGSGSVVHARLRVAHSGLGRAGHWLVQAVALAAQGCGKGDSGKDWGGEEML